MHEAAQWQAYLEVMHMTWVRAPGLSYPQYYFSNNNHIQVNIVVPWYISKIQPATRLICQSKGYGWENSVDASQHASTLTEKVKWT